MKNFAFLITGCAALALAACNSGNQDTVENAELNQPAVELNAAEDTADANAEAVALGTQQDQLENEAAADENAATPTDEQEQNVSGM